MSSVMCVCLSVCLSVCHIHALTYNDDDEIAYFSMH